MPRAITVLLAIERPALRDGLRALLEGERGIRLVGEPVSLVETLVAVRRSKPDVLVLGATLSGRSTLHALVQLKYASPSMRIILVAMDVAPDVAARALEMGTHRVIPLLRAHDQLLPAIRSAALV